MQSQRGFTLLETLLAAAIALLLGVAAIGLSAGHRAFAAKSAATIFDAELAHARAIASNNGNSATLVFTSNAPRAGATISLVPDSGVPPELLAADVSEVSIGSPPFSLTLDATGHVTQPPCPAAGNFTLSFAAGPAREIRTLPCPTVAAGPPEPPGTMPP